MRTPARLLHASLLVLVACGGGGGDTPPPAERSPLDVLSFEAPDVAMPSRTIHVEARGRDPQQVASLEVRLSGRTYTADAVNGVVALDLPAPTRGFHVLEAVLSDADGKAGPVARRTLAVDDREPARDPFLDKAVLMRRIDEWHRKGGTDTDLYSRGDLYAKATLPGFFDFFTNWWITWKTLGGPQPFEWAQHCPGASGITLGGEVLRCWLALNPQVAQAIQWQVLDLDTGNATLVAYPNWSESMKEDLDTTFFYTYSWLASGLLTPFPIPPDPTINMIPSTSWGSATAFNPQQAWVLYTATVAHGLALEIGGFVPWSVLNYGPDDLLDLFSSKALFTAEHRDYTDVSYTGYWVSEVVHAFPKTTFSFFVDEDIIRWSHQATITRLLEWSGSHLVHAGSYGGDADDVSGMEYCYMHWQYYGKAPVQRMLAGTVRANVNMFRNWTYGCTGTSAFYQSVLRALNIPAYTLFGWGEDDEPHLDGHTVPVFPTLGKTMSHADEIYAWHVLTDDISPPPNGLSPYAVLISWDTFVDWFYTHPDHNTGRQRAYELRIDTLPDEILDLHCQDLLLPYFTPLSQTAVYARFAEHYTVSDLIARDLWTRLAQKEALLDYCQ